MTDNLQAPPRSADARTETIEGVPLRVVYRLEDLELAAADLAAIRSEGP